MTLEMGKPLKAAAEEAAKCATACRYYAEHGTRLLADRPSAPMPSRSFVRFSPIGTVLAVMPWNFPFWQVFRFAAPALIAGNTGLLKHASNVPQCALAIEDILRRAGAPQGVFQTLLIGADQVERIIADPACRRCNADGKRRRRHSSCGGCRQSPQEDRPRTRRQRSVCGHAQCGSRGSRAGGCPRSNDQQRTVVYRSEALHRARAGIRYASQPCSSMACVNSRSAIPWTPLHRRRSARERANVATT
jgi:hypothetical protein